MPRLIVGRVRLNKLMGIKVAGISGGSIFPLNARRIIGVSRY